MSAGALKNFLLPLDVYAEDVADIAASCIQLYGPDEWRAAVLTNEIHGHLGIYSTIGAKMGIRAAELFKEKGIGGEISVISFAGSIPPVSCLNDGLQVSTGASMGHGLFEVAPAGEPSAKACFTCGGESFEMSLKPEYEQVIKADISRGVALYGHAPEYWNYVRRLAVRYWREWDRAQIFAI